MPEASSDFPFQAGLTPLDSIHSCLVFDFKAEPPPTLFLEPDESAMSFSCGANEV
jgi:hypothetical protein